MSQTCQQLIAEGISVLMGTSDSPDLDAELLLSNAIGQSRAWLLAYQDDEVAADDIASYQALLARRQQGEPMAYIFGEREFWSLSLNVNDSVLIPRPDTEILVEQALAYCQQQLCNGVDISTDIGTDISTNISIDTQTQSTSIESFDIVDLGTGSGAIAIALATELKNPKFNTQIQVSAVDQSATALTTATTNAARHNCEHIEFLHGSWFSPLAEQRFNLIVSNPPYIAENDHHLSQGDVRFEPRDALASGIDGLQDIHHLISTAPEHLHSGGCLMLEHGFQQSLAVQKLFKQYGFNSVATINDYAGHPRVTIGTWQTASA